MTEQKTPRTFSLGSEWLYYKIYCGVKTSDKILTEVIKPLTEQLMKKRLIDSWFFIRYADPEIHLRIRFHFTDLNQVGIVISLFQSAILEYEKNGLIWKVQTDTYQREIERYGTNSILLSEQIFHYDSECIVNILDMISGDEGEELRWMFSVRAVDELLSDFNYSLEQKKELIEVLKTSFADEFNVNKNLKMQMDKRFRIHRKTITTVLDRKSDKTSELEPLFKLLKQKSDSIKPISDFFLNLNQSNELKLSLNNLLASHIHMLLNRLFKNKQRLHEMVVYDLMWRTYRSEIAKQKHITKQLVN
jgi:thiopeptide-type bacteriocin biosynthesis protein